MSAWGHFADFPMSGFGSLTLQKRRQSGPGGTSHECQERTIISGTIQKPIGDAVETFHTDKVDAYAGPGAVLFALNNKAPESRVLGDRFASIGYAAAIFGVYRAMQVQACVGS
jgi:hypothetical protein